MKKWPIVALPLAVLLVLSTVAAVAAPPSMGDGDTVWQVTQGEAVFTKLEDKDADWNAILSNGVWGWLTYSQSMEGNLDGEIEVKGLSPNTWYLVTIQGPSGTIPTGPGVGLFGGTDTGSWSWTDVALFKTEDEGEGESDLTSNGGLIGVCGTPGVAGCVPGIAATPSLPSGSYSGVLVAVKDVGSSADGTTPSMSLLTSGGTAVLFEMSSLSFVITADDDDDD